MSFSQFNQFCWVLLFINIRIFDYPGPRLSGLFRLVPTSPDNRGSTVLPIKSKLQHPNPRANPGHLTISCARGVGNLTFTWVGWGKLKQKCQATSDFLLRAPKSRTAMNTCLDEMEEFKGRDRTFLSDWLTKKVFKSCEVLLRHV